MPSSLIFAGLAAAWLAVLVPMIAKRRQEVARTAESALASRVLPRQSIRRPVLEYGQEVPLMSERVTGSTPDERQYRPGRGGYDPEAAALAARAKYLFRQRVVLGLLIGALTALVLAFAVSGQFWWLHLMFDAALAAYLGYLRRQVRIEEEVRARRAARMAGSRTRGAEAGSPDRQPRRDQPQHEKPHPEKTRCAESRPEPPGVKPHSGEPRDPQEPQEDHQPPARRAVRPPRSHPTAVALDLDDEDPLFDELDPAFQPRYRRAVGE